MYRASVSIWWLAAACSVAAQSQSAEPRFDVASVRVTTDQTNRSATVTVSGQRVTVNGFTLHALVAAAYRTETYLIAGPDWMAQTRVVIQALMPEGATRGQLPEMLNSYRLKAGRIDDD